MRNKKMFISLLSVFTMLIGMQALRAQTVSNSDKVVALLNSIETGDKSAIQYVNPNKYIQHNLMAGDGLAGFGELMKMAPLQGFKVEIVRVFEDGDYVFTHSIYDFFGPQIGFDVFRFENGLIVEHWDNLSAITPPNPSGRTQTDGPTNSVNPGNTEENRVAVTAFVQSGLVDGKMLKALKYLNGKNYAQHSSNVGDNMEGLKTAMKESKKSGIEMVYTKNHMILVDDDFALSLSEGLLGDQPTAFYDLFRLEDGKIVEHWDVISAIPPQSEWRNNNGKF